LPLSWVRAFTMTNVLLNKAAKYDGLAKEATNGFQKGEYSRLAAMYRNLAAEAERLGDAKA